MSIATLCVLTYYMHLCLIPLLEHRSMTRFLQALPSRAIFPVSAHSFNVRLQISSPGVPLPAPLAFPWGSRIEPALWCNHVACVEYAISTSIFSSLFLQYTCNILGLACSLPQIGVTDFVRPFDLENTSQTWVDKYLDPVCCR